MTALTPTLPNLDGVPLDKHPSERELAAFHVRFRLELSDAL
jgi:hypothetical protein